MQFKHGLLIIALASLVGCTTLPSSADQVKITNKPVSNDCQIKGPVSIDDNSHRVSTGHQLKNSLDSEYNQLKMLAYKMNANTVYLPSDSPLSDKKHRITKTQHRDTAAHAITGDAYWCPVS